MEWKIAGTATATNSVSIPTSATEVLITASIDYGNAERVFQKIVLYAQFHGSQVIELGGYYNSSIDYGLVNVNVSNHAASIRNFIYAGKDYKSSAQLRIRYR